MDLATFINALISIRIPALGLNFIDILIIIAIISYAIEGYAIGFLASFIDFLSFAFSFIFALTFFGIVGSLLTRFFPIPQGFSNAIGFFIVAVLFEIIFNFVLKNLISSFSFFSKLAPKEGTNKKLNKFLGIIPSVLSAILLSSFVVSLIISLPFSVFLKHGISDSKMGNFLASNTQGFTKDWSNVFGGAINETLSFLTIEPKSSESVALKFKTSNISVDNDAEQKMLVLVNKERTSRGFKALLFDEPLAEVGRNHCSDMFKRGYFSHYTPEGASPFDRMVAAGINFNYAGENLALAPNVDLSMQGLMQSPGHKANILSTNFNRVGIGVIDGGIYGEMFCQEFTD